MQENTLQIGDKNQLVVLLQQFLCMHGFYIACDGSFGPITKNSLSGYQIAHNLPVTGIADATLVTLIQQPTKIDTWALAIKSREGFIAPCAQYPEGTPAWRNNDPGNIRKNNADVYFPTYQAGYNALRNLLIRACTGHSTVYSPNDTIYQFFSKYSPVSDNNDPVSYAAEVAGKLGVSVDTLIKDLLN